MIDERVSLGRSNVINVSRHIARYNLALSFIEKGKVLDASCGTGYGSFLMSKVCGSVTGVDISPEAVLEAKESFTSSNLSFKQSDMTKLGEYFSDRDNGLLDFDCVVSFETLEHLENPNLFLNELPKILKPNGLFIYSLPLFEKKGQNQYHHHTFDVESARSLVKYPIVSEYIQSGINFYYPYEIDGGGYYFSVRRIV